jgi:hypothetical protein
VALGAAERSPLGRACVVDVIDPDEIFRRDGWVCAICGERVEREGARRLRPTLDHVVPLVIGGLHSRGNLRTAHGGCNASNGAGFITPGTCGECGREPAYRRGAGAPVWERLCDECFSADPELVAWYEQQGRLGPSRCRPPAEVAGTCGRCERRPACRTGAMSAVWSRLCDECFFVRPWLDGFDYGRYGVRRAPLHATTRHSCATHGAGLVAA